MRLCSGRQTQQWLLQLSRYSACCQPDMVPTSAVPVPVQNCNAAINILLFAECKPAANTEYCIAATMTDLRSTPFSICTECIDKLVHEAQASSYAAHVDTHSFMCSFRHLQGSLWPTYNHLTTCLTNNFISSQSFKPGHIPLTE